ncbi:glycosyltransferase [Culicoidibacter larvae]|uniref:Glycosyltransferase family 4 protein n=1 Tax=Culicoidibacter larvae TaxID=2579976 RepID=A0A5R8QD94_9FIRM|nr:glycosyltransferase [Culicoidibacter larvae]TLG75235.1 glycosyltransferase family 4 protein [Culicoidibacter larvae]
MNKFVVLTRISKDKNIDRMIQMFAELENKTNHNWTLEIYGNGPHENTCKQLITDLNMLGKINLHDAVSDIGIALNDASIYLNMANAEGFSMAMLEAMSYGVVPVMLNNTIGLNEVIENGQNGFIVKDAAEMKSVLGEVITDMERIKYLGEKAALKSKKFSMHSSINKFISLIS